MREAIETLLAAPQDKRRLLAAAAGASGRSDISERIEEILAGEVAHRTDRRREVAYLLGTGFGVEPEVRFVGDLAAGNLIAEPVVASVWLRIAELVARYSRSAPSMHP